MNLRSKAFGLLVGAAVALSALTGVLAQNQDKATTTVTLAPNPDNACFAWVEDADFGKFVWDGSKYSGEMGGAFHISATQEISPLITDCTFTLSGTDLSKEGGSHVIEAAMITIDTDMPGNSAPLSPGTSVTLPVPTGPTGKSHIIGYSLASALENQEPGTYTGNVTITTLGYTP